jgi:hypothetical protein
VTEGDEGLVVPRDVGTAVVPDLMYFYVSLLRYFVNVLSAMNQWMHSFSILCR